MRKHILVAVSLTLVFACANNDADKQKEEPQKKTPSASETGPKSIPSETSKSVGNTMLKINYTAPAVRGRAIWGALVPYDKVWVTGAHNATAMEVGKDFRMGGKTIPAGKYGLFTIPGREQWTIIVNKKWNQHQADQYTESEDVVRLKVKPQATAENVERLKYEINQKGDRTADITMSWEKLRIGFPIEIQ
jgi:hypothetical protein